MHTLRFSPEISKPRMLLIANSLVNKCYKEEHIFSWTEFQIQQSFAPPFALTCLQADSVQNLITI